MEAKGQFLFSRKKKSQVWQFVNLGRCWKEIGKEIGKKRSNSCHLSSAGTDIMDKQLQGSKQVLEGG